MSAEVGVAVSEILDHAARNYIKQNAPDCYDQFVWQVHGAGTVRHYDGSTAYWRRVQAALDSFFTAAERVEIYRCLTQRAELAGLPECRSFQALAFAENRVADLVAVWRRAPPHPAGRPPHEVRGTP
jgi:hypothetical protein